MTMLRAAPHQPPPSHHGALQLRGSIPLIWTQLPNIKYKPPTKLLAGGPSAGAFDAHMDALLDKYKVEGGWQARVGEGWEGKP